MDSNTPEDPLDPAKAMHHSPEMQLAAYREILNQPTSDIHLEMAVKAMHHSTSTSSRIWEEIS